MEINIIYGITFLRSNKYRKAAFEGLVAQSVERRADNAEVLSSSLGGTSSFCEFPFPFYGLIEIDMPITTKVLCVLKDFASTEPFKSVKDYGIVIDAH